MELHEKLERWLINNLYQAKRFDKSNPAKVAESASVALADAVTMEMVDLTLHDIRREKNFNLEKYPFS
jgi:hypothetical protein